MMKPTYREDKATQAAALFLKWRGGPMSYLKLLKLLYIAEREALLRWGTPITFDYYVSMDHGPVLSQTYNHITGGYEGQSYWDGAVSSPANHEVELLDDPGADKLSDAEEDLLREVFDEHGHKSRWELRDWTHVNLPEWKDPKGTSIRIEYSDILKAGSKSDVEMASILEDLEAAAVAEKYFEN